MATPGPMRFRRKRRRREEAFSEPEATEDVQKSLDASPPSRVRRLSATREPAETVLPVLKGPAPAPQARARQTPRLARRRRARNGIDLSRKERCGHRGRISALHRSEIPRGRASLACATDGVGPSWVPECNYLVCNDITRP